MIADIIGTTGTTKYMLIGGHMRFIAVGDNCVDLYVKQGFAYAGGCSVNFAVYMKQLNVHSAYLGAVGNDEFGQVIIDAVNKHGVDGSHIHIIPGKTAMTKVELVGNDRKFLGYDENVLGEFRLDSKDVEFICSHDFLHTSVFGKIESYLPELKSKIKICYDFADKLTLNLDNILDSVDYGFFSYKKDDPYIRDFLKQACSHGLICAVATLGKYGSVAYDGSNFEFMGVNDIEVVDTIGAGDSFIAGFMYGISLGKSIKECLRYGTQKAEETIGHFGAF
jgi:Sugar kinases, ribokinase family